MVDYYQKYLKYKNKYLNLKSLLQVSGSPHSDKRLIKGLHGDLNVKISNTNAKCLKIGKSVNNFRKPTAHEIAEAYEGCLINVKHDMYGEPNKSLKEMKNKLLEKTSLNLVQQVELLRNYNYSIEQLVTAGYKLQEIKNGGYKLDDFHEYNFKVNAGLTRDKMINLGFHKDDPYLNILFKK